MRNNLQLLPVVFLLFTTFQSVSAEGLFEEHYVFDPKAEDHGHVHASCVIETPKGNLIAVWYENGPNKESYYYDLDADKADNVRIGGSRFFKGDQGWTKPFVMTDTYGISDNNPCMVVDARERLWLVHPTLIGVPQRTWGSGLLQYKVSSDYENPGKPRWDRESILIVHPNGLDEVVARVANQLRSGADFQNTNDQRAARMLERLSDPFARRLGWMPRAHPLALPDGTVLIPFSNENFSVAAMGITKDGGETWEISKAVPGMGITQPSVVLTPSGKLIAFFRAGGRYRRIMRSESTDGGYTWSEVTATSLPNPGAGIEAVMLKNGHLAMIYNDQEESPRDRLAVSISTDEGETWKWTRLVENIPDGRFDYPSMIQASDGSLHATYSYNLKTIKHVHFDVDWVMQGGDSGNGEDE
jgi:hypothetical protein